LQAIKVYAVENAVIYYFDVMTLAVRMPEFSDKYHQD